METILVIGTLGFVSGYLAKALLAEAYAVRGLTHGPARVNDLAALGGKVIKGDISSGRKAVTGLGWQPKKAEMMTGIFFSSYQDLGGSIVSW